MKHIILKQLHMVNFQGFRDKAIEFNDSDNTIRGMNGTGKTTVMRAVNYLLFGKDQFGRTDFEIKPLTKTGEPEHNVDSEVTAEILSGDEEITLKKVYHEIWRKPKGQSEAVFSGHETLCFYNGVPVTMREYNAKIETICPEQLFKLLTNPLYFPSLPWQEQRNLLFKICGDVSDEEIASQKEAWVELFKTINGHKTMDEYKREIASEKRKIKEELEKIPARIDEVKRAIPEEEDWQNLNNVIDSIRGQIHAIGSEITDKSSVIEKENEKIISNLNLLNKKKRELQELEYDLQMEAGQKYIELNGVQTFNKEKLRTLKEEKERYEASVKNLEEEKQQYLNEREGLLKEWNELNNKKEVFFLEEEFVCPTCKRPFDIEDIEAKKKELTARWNEERAKSLDKNVKKGKEVAALIQQINELATTLSGKIKKAAEDIVATEEKIKGTEADLAKAKEQKDNWKILAEDNEQYKTITHTISLLSASREEPKKADVSELETKRESLQKDLEAHLKRLNTKEHIDRGNKRIAELKKEQKNLAQKQADLEKIEYNIQGFIKAKIGTIEDKINSMFSYVSWRMFKQLVNGESEETCEALVNGVPFSYANSAGKVHAGFDIINVLSKHYGITVPCFSDNAESICDFPKTEAQTIKLYVTNDKVLTIN